MMIEFDTAFGKLPPAKQSRFEDRVSFLYLDHRKITQDSFGVVAWGTDSSGELSKDVLQIPVGGLAFLALGPGTSITNAAMTSATRYGCVVAFVTGGAVSANSIISPLTSSSKWAIAQAKVVSNDTLARKVAKEFYFKQFGVDSFAGSIAQMRAIEGSLMKKAYAAEAKRNKIVNFRRNSKSEDNVNVALNICNSILYGISAAAVGALGMN
jgi:CRISPR-associated protein Cas1